MNKQSELFEIYQELSSSLERAPKLEELFILIIQSLSNFSFSEELKALRISSEEKVWTIAEKDIELHRDLYDLNDNVYVLLSDFIGDLNAEIKGESKGKKRLTKVLKEILSTLQDTNGFQFLQVPKNQIKKIEGVFPEKRKGKKRVKIGDVIAVPLSDSGDFALVVALAKNRFGIGYGIIDKIYKEIPQKIELPVSVLKHPRYSGEDAIKKGRWLILFSNEDLASYFPANPELFHSPIDDPSSGPFGEAENEAGELRKLSEEESKEIGLMSKEFTQFYIPSQLEWFISNKLKQE